MTWTVRRPDEKRQAADDLPQPNNLQSKECVAESERWRMKLTHLGISSSSPSDVCHCANDLLYSHSVLNCGQITIQHEVSHLILLVASFSKRWRLCGHRGFFKRLAQPLEGNVENLITDGRCWM